MSTVNITKADSMKQQSKISLLDILAFLLDSWKKLAIAALAGAVLGFGGWFLLVSYQA
jgi:hypothetical protein